MKAGGLIALQVAALGGLLLLALTSKKAEPSLEVKAGALLAAVASVEAGRMQNPKLVDAVRRAVDERVRGAASREQLREIQRRALSPAKYLEDVQKQDPLRDADRALVEDAYAALQESGLDIIRNT